MISFCFSDVASESVSECCVGGLVVERWISDHSLVESVLFSDLSLELWIAPGFSARLGLLLVLFYSLLD